MLRKRILLFGITAALLLSGCNTDKNATSEDPTSDISSTTIGEELPVDTSSEEQSSTDTEESTSAEATAEPVIMDPARKIELSGDPNDLFESDYYCYVEGEDVVLFLDKGIALRGDMLKVAEDAIDAISSVSGLGSDLKHTSTYHSDTENFYFDENIFKGINDNDEKITIIVTSLDDAIEWASESFAVLDPIDFDFEQTSYQTLYHELAHVIQFRNGVDLSSVMDEGFATYAAYKSMKAKGYPVWTELQYFFPIDFNEELITGGEEQFIADMSVLGNHTQYQYGFRFMLFLCDTYGVDIFGQILDEATAKGYSSALTVGNEEAETLEHTEEIKEIIKSQTSENVFQEFIQWYSVGWIKEVNEYSDYMSSLGMPVI